MKSQNTKHYSRCFESHSPFKGLGVLPSFKAFTLIEVLIVITIMAILIGIAGLYSFQKIGDFDERLKLATLKETFQNAQLYAMRSGEDVNVFFSKDFIMFQKGDISGSLIDFMSLAPFVLKIVDNPSLEIDFNGTTVSGTSGFVASVPNATAVTSTNTSNVFLFQIKANSGAFLFPDATGTPPFSHPFKLQMYRTPTTAISMATFEFTSAGTLNFSTP